MKSKAFVAIVLVGSLFLSSCATPGQGPSDNEKGAAIVGTILGAVIGAAVGGRNNRAAGALIGALAGGLLGAKFGSYLDARERQQLAAASLRAAAEGQTGHRIAWGGPAQNVQSPPVQPRPPKKGRRGRTVAAANTGPAWVTPDTSAANADPNAATGWVIPVNDAYVASNGQTCRDLQQVANKNGKTYEQKVRACRTAQGWVVPQA